MKFTDLNHSEYNPYYSNYISLVSPEIDLIDALEEGKDICLSFYRSIKEEKWTYSYDSGKWTILESLLHVIDTERIFAYRALRIARGDKTPLTGFEQDDYIKPSAANERSMESLLEEYKIVRESSILLFKSFSNEALLHIGSASDSALSARAAGFIICGHEIHHGNIIKTRYLN
ncbi:DinB family protein [Leeuwenhoekiella aequorea]|uniref:DinB family protein n=1 Tax=Leeuwenhoekiella aequorea TaxID=283736 RepID=A0A4V1KR30_9FLAO|nr:DinB family protein [Leeuwenhoekiella aequorea]RXG23482.1 DinB family protein [Leeuwenhoekiella aequorea]